MFKLCNIKCSCHNRQCSPSETPTDWLKFLSIEHHMNVIWHCKPYRIFKQKLINLINYKAAHVHDYCNFFKHTTGTCNRSSKHQINKVSRESSAWGQFLQEFTAILYKVFTVSYLKYLLPGDLHPTVSSLRL